MLARYQRAENVEEGYSEEGLSRREERWPTVSDEAALHYSARVGCFALLEILAPRKRQAGGQASTDPCCAVASQSPAAQGLLGSCSVGRLGGAVGSLDQLVGKLQGNPGPFGKYGLPE